MDSLNVDFAINDKSLTFLIHTGILLALVKKGAVLTIIIWDLTDEFDHHLVFFSSIEKKKKISLTLYTVYFTVRKNKIDNLDLIASVASSIPLSTMLTLE